MADLCKFEREQKFVSYDGGNTWSPLQEYRKGQLIEYGSPDCGDVGDMYRWVLIDNDFICVGKNKHTKLVYQVSHDGGLFWYNVYPSQFRAGDLVERNSDFCDNAATGHYDVIINNRKWDPVWTIKCDGEDTELVFNYDSTLEVTPCLTSITISDCVTSIGNNGFSGQCLISVDIPLSVTRIGDRAFSDCTDLTSVTMSNRITSIGNYAFYNCSSLISVNVPTSLESITNGTFRGCRSLTNIIIPSNVASIGQDAFNGCSALTSVTVNATTPPTLGSRAFDNTNDCLIYVPCEMVNYYRIADGWSDYTSRIVGTIPCDESSQEAHYREISGTPYCYGFDKYVEVSYQVSYGTGPWITTATTATLVEGDSPDCDAKLFATYSDSTTYSVDCNSSSILTTSETQGHSTSYWEMQTAKIGSCVTSIGDGAFGGCSSLTMVRISSSITSIGSGAFFGCSGLTEIAIQDSVTSIGSQAFQNCGSLSSLTLGSGVTTIAASAFTNCNSLTEVTIPSGATSIDRDAFRNDISLTSIRVQAINPPTLGEAAFDNTNDCPIYVPAESVNAYKSAWSVYSNRIVADGYGIKYIAKYTTRVYIDSCYPDTALTTATTKPSGYALTEMISANIGECVTSIANNAFNGCSNLSFINIEASIPPTLGDYAFDNTNNCPIFVPSGSVDTYRAEWSEYADRIYAEGQEVFKLKATYISGIYLANCDSNPTLTTATTKPSGYAVSAMTSAQIGECVTSIDNYAFNDTYNGGFVSLTSVTIPSSVTSIGNYSFSGCSNLSDIEIPSGVTYIGSNAFASCRSLTSVTIPTSVTTLNNYVFQNCSGLTSIEIHNSITSIGNWSFGNCVGLTSVSIPSTVTSIGASSFRGCRGLNSITVNSTTPPTIGSDAFYQTNDCPIYVPAESVSTYKSRSGWRDYSSRIQAIP